MQAPPGRELWTLGAHALLSMLRAATVTCAAAIRLFSGVADVTHEQCLWHNSGTEESHLNEVSAVTSQVQHDDVEADVKML